MQNMQWKGVVGTIGLHLLAAGVVWLNIFRAPFPVTQTGTIEVQIHSPAPAKKIKDEALVESTFALSPDRPEVKKNEFPAKEKLVPLSSSLESPLVLPPKEEAYLPSSEADIRPQPELPIIVPYPDYASGKPKGTVILVLYIDEMGVIQHVEVDRSDLPRIFEQTALEAFMSARMQPAIKNGKAIRARMKVMVEFEIK